MTLAECVEAVKLHKIEAVCVGKDNGWLQDLESLAVILSAIAVIATAAFAYSQVQAAKKGILDQIKASRDNQRLAMTLGLLIQMQTNEHWIQNRKKFVELRESKEGLKKHAGEDSEDAFAISAVLNQYELIAVGIDHGILDREMYKKYYRGTVVKDWMAAVQFINEERKENDRFWIELQQLAEQFQAEG